MKLGYNKSILTQMPWSEPIGEPTFQYYKNAKVLPELMAFINTLPLVRNESNLISTTLTLERVKEDINEGIIKFNDGTKVSIQIFGRILQLVQYSKRADLLAVTSTKLPRFAGNVPLFMSAFKEYRNVKYASWDLTDEKFPLIIDSRNLQVIKYIGSDIGWTPEELINYSTVIRTIVGGKTPGKIEGPYSYRTNRTGDLDFDALPPLVKLLLVQNWMYNKDLVSSYAIRSLADIDGDSPTLIDLDLLPKAKKLIITKNELDW